MARRGRVAVALAVLVVVLVVAVVPGVARSDAASGAEPSSSATYHGRQIDLSRSWEGAAACWIAESANTCYDTAAEMRAAMDDSVGLARGIVPLLTCGSSLVLYQNGGFAGNALALSTRSTMISLSTYSFSAITSSYTIGSCNASFFDASSTYPGTTSAGASASSMVSGWDNRITRVYIS